MRFVTGLALSLSVLATSACAQHDLQGAKAEVQETSIKLDLPAVPAFTLPQPNPDGTHTVQEMRLKGNKFLDTEVKVKGYVVWIYDCATSVRTPEMTDKDLAKLLEDEPERCTRPHIYIADKADTAPHLGVMVADLPRALRKDDKLFEDAIYAEMKAAWESLPGFKVGDQVEITGTWAQNSPKGFNDSNGLVVYKAMANLSTAAAGAGAPGASAPGAKQP